MGNTKIKRLTLKKSHPTIPIPVLDKGTYILILQLSADKKILTGKLGRFVFKKGYYGYVGSAFGPGGLTARLRHHLKISDTPHWHVDYLRKEAVIKEIWILEHEYRFEHSWSEILMRMQDTSVPVPGFGSSDCQCQAHLFFFRKKPGLKRFQAVFNNNPPE